MDRIILQKISLRLRLCMLTGGPSSKYAHRHYVQNIRICMGEKAIVPVAYEFKRMK